MRAAVEEYSDVATFAVGRSTNLDRDPERRLLPSLQTDLNVLVGWLVGQNVDQYLFYRHLSGDILEDDQTYMFST